MAGQCARHQILAEKFVFEHLGPKFLEFQFERNRTIRVPAMIDRIIQETKQEKMFMVTHSQGGAAVLVMASERPEYQKKVIAHFALAPAAFVSRVGTSLVKALCLLADYGYSVSKSLGIYEVDQYNKLVQRIGRKICRDGSPLQPACKIIIGLSIGSHGKLNAASSANLTTALPAI